MLFLIGLGLGSLSDITCRAVELMKDSKAVYLESYTSLLEYSLNDLESFLGRNVLVADREFVENDVDHVLEQALKENVSFLVIGDPLSATTHTDLVMRARKHNVEYKIVNNVSVLTAVGRSGLQLYRFGETISLVLWTETWKPESYFDKILENHSRGLHSLCLLDIKVKELTVEGMMRNKKLYESPQFMSVAQACQQILEIMRNRDDTQSTKEIGDDRCSCSSRTRRGPGQGLLTPDSKCVGLARLGWSTEEIVYGSLSELSQYDMGPPIHCLVICGQLHDCELEFLTPFHLDSIETGLVTAAAASSEEV